MYVAQQAHVVNALAPVDIAGGATSDVFSMKKHGHLTLIVVLGVTGGASTITVLACDDFTPSNTEAIPFAYFAETTAAGDTLAAKALATDAGFATSTNDGVVYVIEIDAADLPDGKPNVQVALSDPTGATFAAVVAILSEPRYAGDLSATAIA
jgi:hypothetical protein